MRYVRARCQDLRDEHSARDVWDWDTWTIDRLGVDERYAHQAVRCIYFTGIEPAWLRELAKRWARWRITSVHAVVIGRLAVEPGEWRGALVTVRVSAFEA
ncbi:MAG: hypothetical protein LC790_08480 [Actinobacteria bacterium]|nr:hypothetical protein [Actinomycetota bacterium]